MKPEQAEERRRLRRLLREYCFNDRCGLGCKDCPVSETKACDTQPGCSNSYQIPMEYLKDAEIKILEERIKANQNN